MQNQYVKRRTIIFLIHPVEGICQTEDYVIIYAREKFNEDQTFQVQTIQQLKC